MADNYVSSLTYLGSLTSADQFYVVASAAGPLPYRADYAALNYTIGLTYPNSAAVSATYPTSAAVSATYPTSAAVSATYPTSAAVSATYPTSAGVASNYLKVASNLSDLNSAATARTNLAVREKIAASRTYYVRKDGSDSNDGLADTAGGAFLTVQKAVDTVMGIDLSGDSAIAATIQVASGTYNGKLRLGQVTGLSATKPSAGDSQSYRFVNITGDVTTPGNVIITNTTAIASIKNVIEANGGGSRWQLNGLTVLVNSAAATGWGILAQHNSHIRLGRAVNFNTTATGFIVAMSAAFGALIDTIPGSSSCTLSGNWTKFLEAEYMGHIDWEAHTTWSGTPQIDRVLYADQLSQIFWVPWTQTGTLNAVSCPYYTSNVAQITFSDTINGAAGLNVFDRVGFADNILGGMAAICASTTEYELAFTAITSAVNYIGITNAVSGSNPTISALGSAANVALTFSAKNNPGSRAFTFNVGSATSVDLAVVGANLPTITVEASVADAGPGFRCRTTDTGFGGQFLGTMGQFVYKDDAGTEISGCDIIGELIDATAGSVDDYFNFRARVAGTLTNNMAVGDGIIVGNKANISFPGAGNLGVNSGYGIYDAAVNELLLFQGIANATEHLYLTNAVSGSSPTFKLIGSAANVSLDIQPKGSGTLTVSGANVETTLTTANARIAATGAVFDGGGSAVAVGTQRWAYLPYAATINEAMITATPSCSAMVDVWVSSYGNFPPVIGGSITASAQPTITNGIKNKDTTLTGWTTSIGSGSFLMFNVASNTAATVLELTLKVTKT